MAFRADSLHGVSLAIRSGGDDEHSELRRGVAEDKLTDFPKGADIEGADKDVGARLDEPALQVAADGGWDIVANEDSHGERLKTQDLKTQEKMA